MAKHPNLTPQEQEWFNYLIVKPQLTQQESNYLQWLQQKLQQMPALAQMPNQYYPGQEQPKAKKGKQKPKAKTRNDWAWETYAALIVIGLICLRILYNAFLR